jgi:ABC-type transporter Mla subunit MlaD
MKKKPESSTSHAKMREVRITEAPFTQGEKGLEVDQMKLAQLWAATQEALQAVGDGFVTVVDSINSLMDDNAEVRKSNDLILLHMRRTRVVVISGICINLTVGFGMLLAIYSMVDSATADVTQLVKEQRALLKTTQEETRILREETKTLSNLQTQALTVQLATVQAEGNSPEEVKRKVMEAEVEVAKAKLKTADSPEKKQKAKKEAREVIKKAKSQEQEIGPVEIEELAEGL